MAPQYSAAWDSASRCSNALSRCSMSASSRYFAAISRPARAAPNAWPPACRYSVSATSVLTNSRPLAVKAAEVRCTKSARKASELALELRVGQAPLHGAAADARLLGGLLLGRAAGQRRQQHVVVPLVLVAVP